MGSTIVASKTSLEKAIRLAWLDDLNTFGEDSYVYNNDEKLTTLFGMKEAINSGLAGQRVFAYGAEKGLHVGNALSMINGIGSANWAGLSTVDAVLGSAVAMGKVNANKKAINLFNRARGYIPTNYLESDGNQYINTGFIPNQNTRVVCKLKMEVGTSAIWAFGARTDIGQNAFGFYASGNGYYAGFYGTTDMIEPSSLNTTEPILVELNKNVLTIDGANTVTATTQTFTPNIPMYLFGCNTNGTLTKGIATIYYCQIYDGETLVRDFVPAKDFSGVGCMYDKVTKRFFYNEGTGVFADGAANGDATVTYTELEYIQSNGSQYIDTGFAPTSSTSKTKIVTVVELLENKDCAITGSKYYSSSNSNFNVGIEEETLYWNFGNTTNAKFSNLSINTKYSIECQETALKVTNISTGVVTNGTTSGYGFNGTTDALYVFWANGDYNGNKASMKLYSYQIYDNDTLVMDIIPVRDHDGVVCLYDKINGEFLYNAGTGEFIGGPAIDGTEVPTEPVLPYTELEYVMSGDSYTNYIDTGIVPTANTKIEADFQVTDYSLFGTGTTIENTLYGVDNGIALSFSTITKGKWYEAYGRYGEQASSLSSSTENEYFTADDILSRATIYQNGRQFNLTINGFDNVVGILSSTVSTNSKLYIFNSNTSDSNRRAITHTKLYSFKIYENDALVRDFVPAKDGDGTVCLYDTVTGEFYYMTGDTLTAGPEIA